MSSTFDDGRPPLAPVGPGRQRRLANSQHVYDPRESEENQHQQQSDANEPDDIDNKFELMHVKIVVYGLSGVLCQTVDKKKRRLHGPTFPSANSSPSGRKSEGATTTSTEITSGHEAFFMQVPTTAIVVFERKAMSSQTSMFSYLPSLPLGIPTHASLHSSRYAASWPAELHASYSNEECSAIDRSSFTFNRVMKLESFSRGKTCNGLTTYVPETIDLLVHLGRGTEMIALGSTSLVITGDEEAEVQLNLPVKELQLRSKRSIKTLTGCRRKPSFSNDASNIFVLDDNARLRVGLQVTPHKTILALQARAEREREMMEELEKFVEEITMVDLGLISTDTNSLLDHEFTLFGENEKTLLGSPVVSSKTEPSVDKELEARMLMEPVLSPVSERPRTNFFCGAAICNDRGNVVENDNFLFSDLTQNTRSAACQRREELSFRESSVMSSISESSDESEFTDLGGVLNRQVVVLKHKQGVA